MSISEKTGAEGKLILRSSFEEGPSTADTEVKKAVLTPFVEDEYVVLELTDSFSDDRRPSRNESTSTRYKIAVEELIDWIKAHGARF